jgi:3-hydroxymyristoyl/3-hydroxydecanoyl-(acyl carrier protein) dehydratase
MGCERGHAVAIPHNPAMHFVIPHDHPSLPGHFPGQPVVPGVVLLDRIVAAIEATHGPLGPTRLPQVKFLQPLLPGEEARIELVLRQPQDESAGWRFRVLRGDALLASGEIIPHGSA